MAKKISDLPTSTLPYGGGEGIPIVQNGETVEAPLSSLASYLSAFSSPTANTAYKNINNNFTTGQTINGALTSTSFTLSGSGGNGYSLKSFPGTESFGITNVNGPLAGDYIFGVGKNMGQFMGQFGGTLSNIISIGNGSGASMGAGGGVAIADIVAIGQGAGSQIAFSAGTSTNVVAIGKNAGYGGGSYVGSFVDVVCIGQNAGYSDSTGKDVEYFVAIGSSAGAYVDGGSEIIAIGTFSAYDAGGQGSGSLSYSINIGANSGYHSGSSSVGFGGSANTIFIGRDSGHSAGTSLSVGVAGVDDIIAIGRSAGYGIGASLITSQTGDASDIIAIGRQSGYEIGGGGPTTAGSATDIIAIGRDSGYQSGYNGTASNNIFIGLSSGHKKNGIRNTFVGDYTNTSPSSASTLSGCIAIGYGAQPTAPNTIAIGSSTVSLSVVPGVTFSSSVSGLKIMVNGKYFTIPLLA